MSTPPDLPDRPEAPRAGGRSPGVQRFFLLQSVNRRHIVRIALITLGIAIYLPAVVLMTIQVGGPADLQAMFDWLTGQCGAGCSGRAVLATAIQIAPIVVTAPVLAWIAIIWVIRGRRSDREVKLAARHLETAPDRVSPYAVEEQDEERYLYRDRQGRLRPVYAPPPPSP